MLSERTARRAVPIRGLSTRGLVTAALLVAAGLAVISAFPLGVARATTLQRLGFAELTATSHLVLTGRVTDLYTHSKEWPGIGTVLFTDVTIAVETVMRGSWTKSEVVVEVPGGELDGIRQLWPGTARFARDERVLVFLRPVRDRFWTTGWEQGKYRLTADGQTVIGGRGLPIGVRMELARIEQYVRLAPPKPSPSGAKGATAEDDGAGASARAEEER